MKAYQIEISTLATADLSDIWEYFFLYDNEKADSFIQELIERIYSLQTFPLRGTVHEDLENTERYLVHKKYNIIYEVKNSNVRILRILHSSRNIQNYL